MEQFDQDDLDDPHTAAIYADTIHKNLLEQQLKFAPKSGYM